MPTTHFLKKSKPEKCNTKADECITDGQENISFALDEYDPYRFINCTAHDCKSEHEEDDQFDMIIGKN